MDSIKTEILFKPFSKQLEFLEAVFSEKYSFVLYGGAIRGGKTYALLGLFILLCKIYPASRWAIVRCDLPTIKRNLYPSWDKIKPINFIKHHDKELHTVTFNNNSQLIFFPESFDTDKELNRWRGLEVNGFGFEEINECQRISLGKAFERAGSYIIPNAKKQPPPIVVATCNPSFGWVKNEIYNPFQKHELNPAWHYIQSRIYDNEILLKEQPLYLKSLKDNLNRFEYEVFVEGNWDIQLKTGGEFYKCFDLENHVRPVRYNPLLPLHVSWDDNAVPYLPAGIFQVEGKEIRMIDEIAGVSPDNTIDSVCKEIKRLYQGHESGMFIYGDATANKQDTKLEHGYNFYRLVTEALFEYHPSNRVLSSNPSVVMRGKWINTVLEKEIGGIKIIIGENCKKAINDLLILKESADGTKLKEMETDSMTKVRYQKVGHFSDLFDYVMVSCFSHEYAIYQHGNSSQTIRGSKLSLSKNSY
jgi:hypothetical protein